jgi:flagellar capping protein FliD
VSIAAALTSQKEAVAEQTAASQLSIGKSETATLKSLDQLGATFATAIDSLRREITDNKDRIAEVDRRLSSRLDTGEGHSSGLNQGWAYLVGATAACSSIIAIILLIVFHK